MAVLLGDNTAWTWQGSMAATKRPLPTIHYATGRPPLPTVVEHMRPSSPELIDYRPPKKKFKDAHRLFNNDDVNLMSWVKKQPENWTTSEVLDWVYFLAKESPGINGTTFRGDRFRALNGQQLCDMTLEQFQEKDPIHGLLLHAVLQRLLRITHGSRKSSQVNLSMAHGFLLSNLHPILSKPSQTDANLNTTGTPENYIPTGGRMQTEIGPENYAKDTMTSDAITNSHSDVLLKNSSISYLPPRDPIIAQSAVTTVIRPVEDASEPRDYTTSSMGLLQYRPPFEGIQTSRPSLSEVTYPYYRPSRITLMPEQPCVSQMRMDNDVDLPVPQSYSDQTVPYIQTGNTAEQNSQIPPDELRQRLQMAPRLVIDGLKRSPGRPRKNPDAPLDLIKPKGKRGRKPGQTTKGNHLWEFIRDLLQDLDYNPSHVRWEDRQNGIFMIVRSNEVAQMWGMHKNNKSMTYEKFSRSMRYAREVENFTTVPKDGSFPKKLCFQFGNKSKGWKEDTPGSIITKGWRIDGRGAKPKVKVKAINEKDEDECQHGRSKRQCFQCGSSSSQELNHQIQVKIKSSKESIFNSHVPITENVQMQDPCGKPKRLKANLIGYHTEINGPGAKMEQVDLRTNNNGNMKRVIPSVLNPPLPPPTLDGPFQPAPISSQHLQLTPPAEQDSDVDDDDDPINVLDVSCQPEADQEDTPPNSIPRLPILDGPYEEENRPGSTSSNVTDASSLLLKKGDQDSNPVSPETNDSKTNVELLQPYPGPPPALIPTKMMPASVSPTHGLIPRHRVPLPSPYNPSHVMPSPMFSAAPGLVLQPLIRSPMRPSQPGQPTNNKHSSDILETLPVNRHNSDQNPGLIAVSELTMPPPVHTSSPRPQMQGFGVPHSAPGPLPLQYRPFSNGLRPIVPPHHSSHVQQPPNIPVVNTSSGPVRIVPSLVHTRNGPIMLAPQVRETSIGPVLFTPQVVHTINGPMILQPHLVETMHGPILMTPPIMDSPSSAEPQVQTSQGNANQPPASVQSDVSPDVSVVENPYPGRRPALVRVPLSEKEVYNAHPSTTEKVPSSGHSDSRHKTPPVSVSGSTIIGYLNAPATGATGPDGNPLVVNPSIVETPDGPILLSPPMIRTTNGPKLLPPPVVHTSKGPMLARPPLIQTSNGPVLLSPPVLVDSEETAKKSLSVVYSNSHPVSQFHSLTASREMETNDKLSSSHEQPSDTDSTMSTKTPVLHSMLNKKQKAEK